MSPSSNEAATGAEQLNFSVVSPFTEAHMDTSGFKDENVSN